MNIITNEIKRLQKATGYSMKGLQHAWQGEAAFRFEVLLAIIFIPTAIFLPVSTIERILLIAVVLLVLIVELLNSAVEAAIDRIGSEHHSLSGQAKDLGSAAVFVALFLHLMTWGLILFDHDWFLGR